MPHALEFAAQAWIPIPPVRPPALADARLQLHHAAQIANAPAISYLGPAPDDSHTNFGWDRALGAFVSRVVTLPRPISFAWRVRDLTLLALDADCLTIAECPLAGRTLGDGHAWARARCEQAGGSGAAYTAAKHYEIPRHAVDAGTPFGADAAALAALAMHWENSARLLDAIHADETGASEVRLWPHHFDLGLLVVVGANRSIGIGFTPGDAWYEEPYWYVSPYPAPAHGAARPALASGAHWHDMGWFGAVLRWSAYASAASQGHAAAAYLRSALSADKTLLAARGADA